MLPVSLCCCAKANNVQLVYRLELLLEVPVKKKFGPRQIKF
jgi:hypothetical protein